MLDPRHHALDVAAVREAVAELVDLGAVERLYDHDATLWSADPAHQEVARTRLGWLDVDRRRQTWAGQVRALASEVREAGLGRVVLAGMGGSSLAPEVFAALSAGADGASLRVLDSTHPSAVEAAFGGDLSDTLVVVSSKSGTTVETAAFAAYAQRRVPGPHHLVAITDPGSPLADHAAEGGWRRVLENSPDIGGRYSALSLFGMAPAALVGTDVEDVWDRAVRMRAVCDAGSDPRDNPALVLAAWMGGWARAGRDKLTLLTAPTLAPLGDWIEQLVAESTGKDGRGIVPVVGEPPVEPSRYGKDRAFVELALADERAPGADEVEAAGLPLLSLRLRDRADLGAAFFLWEAATALTGLLLRVDPFDEPNVAESKQATAAVLADVAAGGQLPEPGEGDLDELLADVGKGDYLSIQAYLEPTQRVRDALTDLRRALLTSTGAATTLGFGPRFLHSTGQLHKGGPASLVALQLVDPVSGGPDVPGEAYDFATLMRAQAEGDRRSLGAHNRRTAQLAVRGADKVLALSRALG